MKLSIIIPSYKDPCLSKTIGSLLINSELGDDLEIIVVLDGYTVNYTIKDPKVRYILLGANRGMRGAINAGMLIARGEYLMKIDEHCRVAQGFDKIMIEHCGPKDVMTCLRHALDVDTWELMGDSPTGYEKLVIHENYRFAGVRWRSRDELRKDYPIDETMAFQGSCYVMHRDWWDDVVGPLQVEGYGSFIQEMTEIGFKTWKAGGRLMLNKLTWYAHKHRKFKRSWSTDIKADEGRAYALSQWRDYYENKVVPKWYSSKKKITEERIEITDLPMLNSEPIRQEYRIKLSVIIPSWKDPYLINTIDSLLESSQLGDQLEIIAVLDGYVPEFELRINPRVNYVFLGKNRGMRGAINAGVSVSCGEFIMRTDEHCMFAPGFDKAMTDVCQSDWIMNARRYFLNPKTWSVIKDIPYVDYEKLVNRKDIKFEGQRWPSRDKARKDKLIDEDMAMQGSVWLMSRSWWDRVIVELQSEGYGTHLQDSHEMIFKTWKAGGKLMLHKGTWFAHKHRDFSRTHGLNNEEAEKSCQYCLKVWKDYYETEVRPKWGI